MKKFILIFALIFVSFPPIDYYWKTCHQKNYVTRHCTVIKYCIKIDIEGNCLKFVYYSRDKNNE